MGVTWTNLFYELIKIRAVLVANPSFISHDIKNLDTNVLKFTKQLCKNVKSSLR